MQANDPSAAALVLEAEVQGLQQALQQGVRALIECTGQAEVPPNGIISPEALLYAAGADSPSLRAGVNASKADHGALVALLISLDVITLEQYQHARVKALRAEVEAYETVLAERMGQAVPLVVKPETEGRAD